jgi:hypothetical protein
LKPSFFAAPFGPICISFTGASSAMISILYIYMQT